MRSCFSRVPAAQPTAPRDLRPLISTLGKLRLDRVYASYWVAYVLDFDTRERIIAVENKFDRVSFVGGQAIPADDPFVKYPPYEREVKAARQLVHRKLASTARLEPTARLRRLSGMLARKGYPPGLVLRVVREALGAEAAEAADAAGDPVDDES